MLFDPNMLNPLSSVNDTDPISLERIYSEGPDGLRRLALKPGQIFTYTMTEGGKSYQRSLELTTLRDLLRNNIRTDPFSNKPFPEDILRRAMEKVQKTCTRRISPSEAHNIRMNHILDHFTRVGYIINPTVLRNDRKGFYTTWYNEVTYLWSQFKRDNPEMAQHVYPPLTLPLVHLNQSGKQLIKAVTSNLLEFMEHSFMCVMVVLSGLAWIVEDVRHDYPDLVVYA